MYLVIFEDNTIQKGEEIDDDLKQAADDGICDILDISVPENPLQYGDDEWVELPDIGTGL